MTLEATVVLVLSAISLLVFFRRFYRIVQVIRSARPDADFEIRPLAKRIRDFVWEVVCQAKVIRERPLPGLAHALVFWGFCAFALVTLNHVASAFELRFLDYSRIPGAIYYWFAFAWAILVAISIASLAFRRFVIRPKWLEPLSYESGVIALLIFILMVTFITTLWIPEMTVEGRVNWWMHTLALFAFLPLIPHTKHLHLLLSPVTVFLSRGGFSRIPPLSGDEDFGLAAGKDVTRLTALQAYSCVECGRCTEHCPANNTGKTLNPKLIALGMRDYLNKFGVASETPIVGATISQEAIFQCTTCGACEYQCPVGIEHLPLIIGLRRAEVNTGRWDDEYGTKLFLNLERNGNAMGFAQSERDKFVAKQQLTLFDGSQEYCLWLGCMGAYDPQGREIIAAFADVMRHLGTSFGVLKKERCTGDPVRRLGNDLVFGQLAETNLSLLRQSGAKKLVSICPHCVRTIAEDWKEFGVDVSIEHHSEFMARHLESLPQLSTEQSVVFHDPCYLGRYRGVYNEPRAVIAKSATVLDPPRARERSFCCGAGGGLVFLGEETGQRVNETRARELAATGASVVGTACPFCNSMFRDALKSAAGEPPRLLDIAQITAASLKREPAKTRG
ncbi:MAG: heterodisulfide reductase-related iron-sulfur binding cluster [Bryobacteraceae bacterium]